jgi:hypothetical protein
MELKRLRELSGIVCESIVDDANYDNYSEPSSSANNVELQVSKKHFESFIHDMYSHLSEVKVAVHEAQELVSEFNDQNLVELAEQLIKDYKKFTDDVQLFVEKTKASLTE